MAPGGTPRAAPVGTPRGDSTPAADASEVEDTLIEGAADDVFDEETQAALSTRRRGCRSAEALGSAVLVSLASGAAAAAAAAGGNATGNETTVNVVSLATPEVNMTIVLAASPAAFANQSFACDTPSGEAASVQLPEAALESALAGLAAQSEGDDGESYGVGMVVYTRAAPRRSRGRWSPSRSTAARTSRRSRWRASTLRSG